jgi:hypothetical protein
MNLGTSSAPPIKNSIFVVVNELPATSFTPLRKTSQVEPFHLIASFVLLVTVPINVVLAPAILLVMINGMVAPFLISNPLLTVLLLSEILNPLLKASRVYAIFPLNSTNQVPPLLVIKPLVKMLLREKESATLVADAVVVGM